MRPLRAIATGVLLPFLFAGSATALTNSVADHVKDGPAAQSARKALHYLEAGEETMDAEAKLEWYERGKKLAETAIREDDQSPDAHFALFANWGRILQTDGWVKNAHHLPALWRELDRALELDPNHSAALGAKGGMYLQLPTILGGSVAKAEPLLRRAIETDPKTVGARLELADCYLQTNRSEEARELAETALRLAREQGKQRFVGRAQSLLQEIQEQRLTSQ